MSAYSGLPMLPQQNPPHPTNFISQYPVPPVSPGGTQQTYLNVNVDPQLNHSGAHPQPHPQPQTQKQTHSKASKADHTVDGKARLRKACDSCSIRKVKCDEAGPPCKACSGLEIPCTYARPSKRRGPPNRHAESLKKGRYDSPAMAGAMSGQSQPSSPTHAAQTLASLAQQPVLSGDPICPRSILYSLVDDYFTYIHPLIPLPHKPSFYAALQDGQDRTNPTFMALLASMIGCLVASFPRRPRRHFRAHNLEHEFPSSMSLVARCHQVVIQAQGPGYLDGPLNIDDAMVSYLQGLIGAYTYERQSMLLYFKQCLAILSTIGVHKAGFAKTKLTGAPQAMMIPNGHSLEATQSEAVDYVLQELGKRTFWLMFASVKSLQQIGVSQWELFIPPATKSEPYPPLPLEIDDEYLTPTQVFAQPPDIVSELTGFNANVRVYTTYNDLTTIELLHGVDEDADYTRQKRVLENSLQAVKRVFEGLPTELLLNLQASQSRLFGQKYPSPSPAPGLSGPQQMDFYASNGFDDRPIDYNRPYERRRIQYEIQKANMYASQLAIRSYLVEKYLTFCDAHNLNDSTNNTSPGAIAPVLDKYDTSSNNFAMTEQDMVNEREQIVKDFMVVLSSINQINMEPNGMSLISKIRQIASTLLDQPRTHKGNMALRAEEYLENFLGMLMKLERAEPPGEGSEEDEDAQLRVWADLRQYQAEFQRTGGFHPEL